MFSKMIKILVVFLIIFGFNFALFSSARADPLITGTFYVNGATGNDLWDGASPTYISGTIGPKATIQNTLDNVASTSTVIVAPGIYQEELTISKSVNLRSESNNFNVAEEEQTIISGYSKIEFSGNPSNVTFRGFVLSGFLNPGGIVLNNAGNNTIIEYNSFKSSNFIAIANQSANQSTGLKIRNNSFTNLNVSSNAVYLLGFPGCQIENNTLNTIATQGISVSSSSNILISNNTISTITGESSWAISTNATTGTIASNTITNGEIIVNAGGTSNNLNIINNTISNTDTPSDSAIVVIGTSAEHIIASGNNFSGSTNGILNLGAGTVDARNNWWGSSTGPNNLITNPHGTGANVSNNVNYTPFNLSVVWGTSIIGQESVVISNYGPFLARAIKRTNGKIFTSLSINGTTWIDFGSSSGIAIGKPTYQLFSTNFLFYQVVRGTGNKVYLSYLNGPEGWTSWLKIGSGAISDVTFAEFNSKLYVAYRGTSGMFYYKYSSDGTTWSGLHPLNKGQGNINLSVFNNRLIASFRGNSGYYYTQSTANGTTWTPIKKAIKISSDITSAEFQNKLYQTVRTSNGKIYIRSSADGISWEAWNNGDKGIGNSTLASTTNFLYQFKRGSSKTAYYRISPNGYNWGSWYSTGQKSESDYAVGSIADEVIQTYRYTNNYIYTSVGKSAGIPE